MTKVVRCDILDRLSREERSDDVWKVHSEKSGNISTKYNITTIAQGFRTLSIPKKALQKVKTNVSIQNWANQFSEFISRVWSWLRTNAGGVPNTCKSSENLLIDPFGVILIKESGGRVSNAWVTCLQEGDNIPKGMLIPHNIYLRHLRYIKDLSPEDGLASD